MGDRLKGSKADKWRRKNAATYRCDAHMRLPRYSAIFRTAGANAERAHRALISCSPTAKTIEPVEVGSDVLRRFGPSATAETQLPDATRAVWPALCGAPSTSAS